MADSFVIQPLVVMSIADHYNRTRYQKSDKQVSVCGALIGVPGTKSGKIYNICETIVDLSKGEVDLDFTKERLEAYKQVFKTYEFLGWYSTFPDRLREPSEIERKLHAQFSTLNENCVYLQMATTGVAS